MSVLKTLLRFSVINLADYLACFIPLMIKCRFLKFEISDSLNLINPNGYGAPINTL